MTVVRKGSYAQILIPNEPIRRSCVHCGEDRLFRLLTRYEFKHLAYVFRWDYEEANVRICEVCGHAYAVSEAEMKRICPSYQPLPAKNRRRLVFILIWVPVIAYVIYWNLRKFGGF